MTDSTQPEAAKVQAPVTGPTRQGQGSQDVVSSHRC